MADYTAKKIDSSSNSGFDVYGLKLSNNKTCCYWMKSGSKNINEMVIILNNGIKYEISNNQLCVSFNNISDINDIKKMLSCVIREISKLGIGNVKIIFIVSNKKEEDFVNKIIGGVGIDGVSIKRTDAYLEEIRLLDRKKEEERKELVKKQLEQQKIAEIKRGQEEALRKAKEAEEMARKQHMLEEEKRNQVNNVDNIVKKDEVKVRDFGNEMDDIPINKEIGQAKVYKPEKVKKLSRTKESSRKSSGLISLPVILFIISLILLIGSGIILYMMK